MTNDPLHTLLDDLLAGDRRALARTLSRVEDGGEAGLRTIAARLHPVAGEARTLGVTGAPGVGKSTLTNAMVTALRDRDRRVAVLAVDPSSPFSGGALLGDRVRMQQHHADHGVYVRSMAARGHLGGLAVATPQAVLVLAAAGFDDVIVETVGVGQSEVDIASMADTTVVAAAPGMGDAVQAAKAGILEVADVFVVTKDDQAGSGKLVSELRGMLEMGHAAGTVGAADEAGTGTTWWPPIVRTVAVRDEGISDVLAAVDDHGRHLGASGEGARRRRRRMRGLVRDLGLGQLRARVTGTGGMADELDDLVDAVLDRELDPWTASDRLVAGLT